MAGRLAAFHLSLQARANALRRYAAAFDHFAELEQTAHVEGNVIEHEGAHRYALIALRAFRAEVDDPEPEARDG